MSDNHYGEHEIELGLTTLCEDHYYSLLSKLERAAVPVPSITVFDNDKDNYFDGTGLFLQSSLAKQDPDEQVLTVCRIAAGYLQYHNNPRIRAVLDLPEPSEAQGLQVRLFTGIAMTYGSLLGVQKETNPRFARRIAGQYRDESRAQTKSCIDKYLLWYGADAFLRDLPFDRVLALWSPRCLNRAKLTHLEGVEPYLIRIKEAVRLENDGSGI